MIPYRRTLIVKPMNIGPCLQASEEVISTKLKKGRTSTHATSAGPFMVIGIIKGLKQLRGSYIPERRPNGDKSGRRRPKIPDVEYERGYNRRIEVRRHPKEFTSYKNGEYGFRATGFPVEGYWRRNDDERSYPIIKLRGE